MSKILYSLKLWPKVYGWIIPFSHSAYYVIVIKDYQKGLQTLFSPSILLSSADSSSDKYVDNLANLIGNVKEWWMVEMCRRIELDSKKLDSTRKIGKIKNSRVWESEFRVFRVLCYTYIWPFILVIKNKIKDILHSIGWISSKRKQIF